MKKLLAIVFAAAILFSVGCHISNYPVLTDSRGSFQGVIRTGHQAYIIPTAQIATIWGNGTDELLNFVFQNQYGDQTLTTKRNFDPTASVIFVDNGYCDWRVNDDCWIARSWNPATGPDDIFDFDGDSGCEGYRSLSVLVSQGSRVGECGDGLFWDQKQDLFAEFANLGTTTFRGDTAYIVPINPSNATIELAVPGNVAQMPIYGNYTGFVTEDLNFVFPISPNFRHQLSWLRNFTADNGANVTATINYGSLTGSADLTLIPSALAENMNRF